MFVLFYLVAVSLCSSGLTLLSSLRSYFSFSIPSYPPPAISSLSSLPSLSPIPLSSRLSSRSLPPPSEYNFFHKIQPKECLNQCWNKDEKHTQAPNIVQLIDRFNKVSSDSVVLRYSSDLFVFIHYMQAVTAPPIVTVTLAITIPCSCTRPTLLHSLLHAHAT